jgi:peptidoglycan hydrolase FlgJ
MTLPPPNPAYLPLTQNGAKPTNIAKAAEDFEASFLAEMLQPMFEALSTDGLGGGGSGERMFRPMLVDHYARAIARSGGVGIAQILSADIAKLQSAVMPADQPTGAANGADRR